MANRLDTQETRQQTRGTAGGQNGGGGREQQKGAERSQQQASAGTGLARRPQQQQQTALGAPNAYSGGSPFAMMRRMMDDMDRLFSDFGVGGVGLSPFAGFDRAFA